MVDDFAEEISSSLSSGGRPNRGAAPAILIGMGRFGSSCLSQLFHNFDSLPQQIVALSIRADENVKEGISLLSDGENSVALTPGFQGTRSGIYQDCLTYQDDLQKWLMDAASSLLAQPSLSEQDAVIKVYVFGRAEELDGSALSIAFPEIARGALNGFVSNWKIVVNGFILLPKGRCVRGSQIFALLKELQVDNTNYNHVFLVTDANAGGLIDVEGSADLISEFAGLLLEPDFADAVTDILAITDSKIASFGVTSVVHPANRIIADESARFTGELINSALLSSGGESFYCLADEYAKRERLNVFNLHRSLMADTEGELVDRIDIDPLMLSNIPLRNWPDRIASYDAFFGQERIGVLINKIEENLAAKSAETLARLKGRIDELMSEPLALDKTSHFISRLSEKVDEVRVQAEQAKQEIMEHAPDMEKYHDSLVKRIKYLPGALAVASRAALLGVLIFFFTLKFIVILRDIPNRYIDPQYVPPATPTAVLATGGLLILAWLVYKRADHELYKARDLYISAVRQKYRLAVDRHALQILGWWLGDKAVDEMGQRRLTSFKDVIKEEQAAVMKINKYYLQINDDLKAPRADISETRVRRSVYSAFGRQADLKYKKGRYNLADEAQLFTVLGHSNWRNLQLNELSQRLKDFCRQGLAFVDNRSLDRLFHDFSRHQRDMMIVIEDIRRSSQPYIAMSTGIPKITELVGISGGSQSALASIPPVAGQAAIVPIWSPHRMTFVQLVCPIRIEQLSAYSEWRQAYELERNKGEIDCVKGGLKNDVFGQDKAV